MYNDKIMRARGIIIDNNYYVSNFEQTHVGNAKMESLKSCGRPPVPHAVNNYYYYNVAYYMCSNNFEQCNIYDLGQAPVS